METVIATLMAILSYLGYSTEQASSMNEQEMKQTIIDNGHQDFILELEEGNF